jgi:alpha-amylase/alpha-mannosidase (GH57 family)
MKLHFFWHMHQPSYMRGDEITMPWVFLHALKDYFDMPYLVEKTGAKATFNISANLIEQLHIYETTPFKDKFLRLWYAEPKDLSQDEKQYLLKFIKTVNTNLIINAKFAELLKFDILDDRQFVNLEVFFMLSWCGSYLKDALSGFIQKEEFVQNDKEFLFRKLVDFMQGILPYYEKLAKEGIISLFTTPYAHPILPLLLDIENARIANPATVLPKTTGDLSGDAIKHIQKAKQVYNETFGNDPTGFWPAEGAVDEKSLALYAQEGINYIATDEEILHRSGEMDHYSPYVKEGVVLFFRDHALSDLLGFKYKTLSVDAAVKDFCSSLPHAGEEAVVSVILDGENAWEFYANGGYDFLEALYGTLKGKVEFIRAEDIEKSTCKALHSLKPGSWIYGNFNTWIGDDEKNRAWELLFVAKAQYQKSGIQDPAIEEKFLLAECSDWFWWYGKGHYTDFALEFDELFRKHLIDIYEMMHADIPSKLLLPITKNKSTQTMLAPQNFITPVLDGRFSSIFEWYGAGVVFENKLYSTMDMKRAVEKLYFGQDEANFYFAVIGEVSEIQTFTLTIEEEDESFTVEKNSHSKMIESVSDSIIEIKIDKQISKQDVFHIRFDFNGQTVPLNAALMMDKNNDFSDNWFV